MKLPSLKSTSKKRKEMAQYRLKLAADIEKVRGMTQDQAREYLTGRGLIEGAHILIEAFNLTNAECCALIYGIDK